MPDHTFCKTCGRVVWVSDVDEDGNCIFHQKAKPKGKGEDKKENEGPPTK